jgi:uncharacterized membrane protein
MTAFLGTLRALGVLLSLGVALYAAQQLVGDTQAKLEFLSFHLRDRPWALYAHIAASALALGVLPIQFSATLRRRWRVLHRLSGRAYGVAVLIGGLSALQLALGTESSGLTAAGFATLAVLWLITTARGIWLARAGRISEHRAWMIRSASLTFAAVTLRIWLPLSMVAGVEMEIAYAAIAWLCWMPNLLIAEALLLRHRARSNGRNSSVRPPAVA